MYKVDIIVSNEVVVSLTGNFMGIISDLDAEALINVKGAADTIAKCAGITITSKYKDPLLIKGKRLVLVTDIVESNPKESTQVLHISPHIYHVMNCLVATNESVPRFMCEGNKSYKFSLLK